VLSAQSIPSSSAAQHPAAVDRPIARFLVPHDIPALLDLENEKWAEGQAATAAELQQRLAAFPNLSIGSFCPRTGRLVASLFMKPVPDDFACHVDCWKSALSLRIPLRSRSLFGISLSSRAPEGVDALLEFFWPISLHMGWRHIYLGSPVPGLSGWLSRHPSRSVADYVHAKRRGLPLDPQLRYYHGRGFTRIVAVKPGYFPHDRSLNHGVLLRGTVPLSSMSSLWRRMPLPATQSLTGRLTVLL
jgi:hypothetical protein